MIPRRVRLSRGSFQQAALGRRLQSDHFSVVLRRLDTPREGEGGCAAVISKKVASRAVDRHQLKRRMLAVVQEHCSPTRSIIVYARGGAASLPFRELSEELTLLLSRAERLA